MVNKLSFYLTIEYLKKIDKFADDVTDIRICSYNKITKTTHNTTYSTFEEFKSLYLTKLRYLTDCDIEYYNYTDKFTYSLNILGENINVDIMDIFFDLSFTPNYNFNIKLNSNIISMVNSNIDIIKQKTLTYVSYSNNIKDTYINNLYSVCYAVPSWTEGTALLDDYNTKLKNNKIF